MPHVFDLFVQGEQCDRPRGRRPRAGLAIVRTLVALHGGEVEARSAGIARGSVLHHPAPAPADGAQPVSATEAAAEIPRPSRSRESARRRRQSRRGDDARHAARLSCGYVVETAADGTQALAADWPRSSRTSPSSISALPGMDGYELAGACGDCRVHRI
jgi:hypothetical protein